MNKQDIWVVDRREGNYVVCENEQRKMKEIPLAQFDFLPEEGDVIRKTGDAFILDQEETSRRKKEIQSRFSKLIKK